MQISPVSRCGGCVQAVAPLPGGHGSTSGAGDLPVSGSALLPLSHQIHSSF